MNIIYLSGYFYPEKYSSNNIYNSLFKELAVNNNVHIITPQPTRGLSQNEYLSYKSYEVFDNIKIYRFSMEREKNNTSSRFIRYIKCNFKYRKTINKIAKKEKIDCIFTSSTPPIISLVAIKCAKKLKVPFIYNLQDIFPDSLMSTNITKKNKLLWKIGRKIENYTYKNADRIVVISEAFKKNIMKKGVPEKKIDVIYNWIDEKAVNPIKRENNKLFDTFNLDRGKFYITYAGNIGNSQNFEVILKVAKTLKENTKIKFIIFGDGSQKNAITKLVKNENVNNIKLFPMQNYDLISEVYSLGDGSIVSCKKGSGNGAFPSKLLSIMATETPVLTSFDIKSELTEIVDKASCGICCDADDSDSLYEAVIELHNNKLLAEKMGKDGRKYLLEHFSKDICVQKYVEVIKSTVKKVNENQVKMS